MQVAKFFLGAMLAIGLNASAQEPALSAAHPAAATQDAQGRALLQEMVTALGGDAFLNVKDWQQQGRFASFFQGKPTGEVTQFWAFHLAADANRGERDRMELTKKRDILEIYTATQGFELTYKGREELPKPATEDFLRRRAHSIDAVARVWMKDPTATVFYNGKTTVARRQADEITIVTAKNDNVTVVLDAGTHLPLRRSFTWRNMTYKDKDEDAEEYDNYQPVQGVMTPYTTTRYRNGDMVTQRFLVKAAYNTGQMAEAFDPLAVPLPRR